MSRDLRLGVLGLVALGAFVAVMIGIGSLGGPRPDVVPLSVTEARADGHPADRWGDAEVYIHGWYAALDADCSGDDGGVDPSVSWLQRECPLRVLLPSQPGEAITQDELLQRGSSSPHRPIGYSRRGPSRPGRTCAAASSSSSATSMTPPRRPACQNAQRAAATRSSCAITMTRFADSG